jgi:hypothetical protein
MRRNRGIVVAGLFVLAFLTAGVEELPAQNTGVVVVTEIQYHPQGGGTDLEFIEILNATPEPLDLSGWFFSQGVSFAFPRGTFLDGGRYLVVCANQDAVRQRYNITNVIGNWASCSNGAPSGCALDNGGETIELSEESGVVATTVRYNDRGRWPAAADGTGHSLEIRYPYLPQDDPESWAISGRPGGSPGVANDTARDAVPVVINEGLCHTAGSRWIEVFNLSAQDVDLSGFFLTDDRLRLDKARIPDGTVVPARGFRTFGDTALGLDFTPSAPQQGDPLRTFVALTNANGQRVIDAYTFEPRVLERSEARIPDGGVEISDLADSTPGAPNRVSIEQDVVVNELLYHPYDNNSSAEFIEILNRSDRTIDIGEWSFTQGANFSFPIGTSIGPGAYLVVARDPAYIREVYGLPAEQVFGPDPQDAAAVEAFGALRDDGERVVLRDALGNVVDSVRYHDGGQWPDWPDGGGSSLELVDAFQDNNVGAAWDSSDDSAKAPVHELSYRGVFNSGEPELQLHLNDAGLLLVDDLTMVERVTTLNVDRVLVETNEEWRYFKGTQEPSEPRDAWRQPSFDDSSWLAGATPIGFGEEAAGEATVLADMRDGYAAFFCRKAFEVADPASIVNLEVHIEYDDGAIAYLNGTRIVVENMRTVTGSPDEFQDTFDALARSSRERFQSVHDITEFKHLLVPGRNVLAVQVHNSTLNSSDARFVPRLVTGRYEDMDSPNFVVNGDFEAPLRRGQNSSPSGDPNGSWQIEGTHTNSGITNVDPISGAGSLKIVASRKGDNKVNNLETALGRALVARNTYLIEFKTRWVVGSPTLVTGGERHDYAKSHRLAVPRNLGTPGSPNSVTLRRIAQTGGSNLGPVIDQLSQSPNLPRANTAVQVTARIQDSDGVQEAKLFWSLNNPRPLGDPMLNEVVMTGPDDRGFFSATIPGQANGQRVVYFILAADRLASIGRFPVDPMERTHPTVLDPASPSNLDRRFIVYRHDNPVTSTHAVYRFWLHQDAEAHLASRRLHSNALVDGSFVFASRDLYHNAGVRFAGSPWARGSFDGFRVSLPKDQPLHGAIKRFNLDSHHGTGGLNARERISNYLIRHNQGNARAPYSFQWIVDWNVNTRAGGTREHIQTPNTELIQRFFPDDDSGSFLEMDDRFDFTDGGLRENSADGFVRYPPYPVNGYEANNPEVYRYYFSLRQNEGLDDFSEFIEFCRLLTESQVPNAEFDARVFNEVNVESMLRVWAIRMNSADWDQWGYDRGKNCYLYRTPNEGLWYLLPWDMELTYESGRVAEAIIPSSINTLYTGRAKFGECTRFWNRPRVKRLYWGIQKEMVDQEFNSGFLTPYMNRLQSRGMQEIGIGRPGGFIDQRANLLRNALRSSSYPQVRLAVTTNGGNDFSSMAPVARIEGQAPIDVFQITLLVNNDEPRVPVRVVFSDADALRWSADVPLAAGANTLFFLGTSSEGNTVDSDAITVTAELPRPTITSVNPDKVLPGARVLINGENFPVDATVSIQGVTAEVDLVEPPSRVGAVVPASVMPGMAPVTVASESGGAQSDPFFIEVLGDLPGFRRADTDLSGTINATDGVQILLFLFGGAPLACEDAADVDDDGRLTLTDAVRVFDYLFRRGAPPAAPFPEIGPDPTPDAIECASAAGG